MDLKAYYIQNVIPQMKEKFGYKNDLAIPSIKKVVANVGLGSDLKNQQFKDGVAESLALITGQKPIQTKAKHSISGFGIREGMVVGLKITLRGKNMYNFIAKMIYIALARVRDFQGLNLNLMDKQGNLSIGFKENTVFPEINPEKISTQHGLQATIITSAKTKEEAKELFKLLGFPFKAVK